MNSSMSTVLRYRIILSQHCTFCTFLQYRRQLFRSLLTLLSVDEEGALCTAFKMHFEILFVLLCVAQIYATDTTTPAGTCAPTDAPTTNLPLGCVCGVFLSGQFKKGSKEQPKGNPALLHEHPDTFPCTIVGNKLCTNKCLDTIVKHLPNSPAILCGSIDRDCHKERAYLFIKNCKDEWINTNLSAGREYCCKDGVPYKCPILS